MASGGSEEAFREAVVRAAAVLARAMLVESEVAGEAGKVAQAVQVGFLVAPVAVGLERAMRAHVAGVVAAVEEVEMAVVEAVVVGMAAAEVVTGAEGVRVAVMVG